MQFFVFLWCLVGAGYVRCFIWAKMIVLYCYGEERFKDDTLPRHAKWWVERHDAFPTAVSVSCVDSRFSDIGDWWHIASLFQLLKELTSCRHWRFFGLRLPGPDTAVHTHDAELRDAHLRLIRHALDVSGAKLLTVVIHGQCAAVQVSLEEHRRYGVKLARLLHEMHPTITILVFVAEPRIIGWHYAIVDDTHSGVERLPQHDHRSLDPSLGEHKPIRV